MAPSVSITLIGKSYFLCAGGHNIAYEYVPPSTSFSLVPQSRDLLLADVDDITAAQQTNLSEMHFDMALAYTIYTWRSLMMNRTTYTTMTRQAIASTVRIYLSCSLDIYLNQTVLQQETWMILTLVSTTILTKKMSTARIVCR